MGAVQRNIGYSVYVCTTLKTLKTCQIALSRTHSCFVKIIFRQHTGCQFLQISYCSKVDVPPLFLQKWLKSKYQICKIGGDLQMDHYTLYSLFIWFSHPGRCLEAGAATNY